LVRKDEDGEQEGSARELQEKYSKDTILSSLPYRGCSQPREIKRTSFGCGPWECVAPKKKLRDEKNVPARGKKKHSDDAITRSKGSRVSRKRLARHPDRSGTPSAYKKHGIATKKSKRKRLRRTQVNDRKLGIRPLGIPATTAKGKETSARKSENAAHERGGKESQGSHPPNNPLKSGRKKKKRHPEHKEATSLLWGACAKKNSIRHTSEGRRRKRPVKPTPL